MEVQERSSEGERDQRQADDGGTSIYRRRRAFWEVMVQAFGMSLLNPE
jgi:hypothetical protein